MSNIIGQVLLDQYRVDTLIASGGVGAVYPLTVNGSLQPRKIASGFDAAWSKPVAP